MTGVERIGSAFRASPGRMKLMTHAVCGYPDMESSRRIMAAMLEAGTDFLEAQLPFSDPSADGPAIVEANRVALDSGATTAASLEMLASLRRECGAPILVMSYLNPLLSFGLERFAEFCVNKGLDGAIIPDCPDDEPEYDVPGILARAGLASVPLIAPSTSPARARDLAAASSSPFVYAVLRMGVTGRKTELDGSVRARLREIGEATGRFVAAGFGIREKSQVEALRGAADCAIVGSAALAAVREAIASGADPAAAARRFVAGLGA